MKTLRELPLLLCFVAASVAGAPAPAIGGPGAKPSGTTNRVAKCVRKQAVARVALPAELFRVQSVCSGGLSCEWGMKDFETRGLGMTPPLWNGGVNHSFSTTEQNSIISLAATRAASNTPPGKGLVYITYMTSLDSATTAYVGGTAHYARCGEQEVSAD